MTINTALSNALSGLTANTRAAGVVSGNIANALTEGYGRREIELTPRSGAHGGGVAVSGITRVVDDAVLADMRNATSDQARADAGARYLSDVVDVLGVPGDGNSLGDAMAALESALVDAAARPESEPRLAAVNQALATVVDRIGGAADAVQQARTDADQQIAREVGRVNQWLGQIETLNRDIRRHGVMGDDTSGLIDQRQNLIDQVAERIPLRQVDRGGGHVALMTPGGAMLLDGKAAVLEFSAANVITPFQSFDGGTLNTLSINGRDVSMAYAPNALSGGMLEGLFDVRDRLAPETQGDLDALARDLLERFADPAVDPTRAVTDPGLLTDGGLAFDPLDELGLAQRLSVNSLADPAQGGELWKYRDGLGAVTQGDVGQAAGLTRLHEALTDLRVPVSGGSMGAARSASGLSADLLSRAGGALELAKAEVAHAGTRADALSQKLLEGGVDSDQEMQKLLQIEQSYAANARVIETVEAMLDSLMRI